MMRCHRPLLLLAAMGAGLSLPTGTPASAPRPVAQETTQQDDLQSLRRDQEEILRKAERLRSLMERLLVRYEREKRSAQAELLRQGLRHLKEAGLVEDVAGIRNDLVASAYSEALRKQRQVVSELERLLNILLERKSLENLDEEIAEAARMARDARDLERRQTELQQRTNEAMRPEPSATERDLNQRLQDLAEQQRAEARNNARQAGARRPMLEAALRQIESLLSRQDKLEETAARESSGEPDPVRERSFQLGELTERTRALMGALRDQRTGERLGDAAKELQEALDAGDASGIEQSRDRLRAGLAEAPAKPIPGGQVEDHELRELGEQLEQAGRGDTEAERERLRETAASIEKATAERSQQRGEANANDGKQLQADTESTAENLAKGEEPQGGSPAESVQNAAKAMQRSSEQTGEGNLNRAMADLSEALRNLDQARERLREQNPDAERRAGSMATDTDRTAKDLRNAPEAADAERDAAAELDAATEALREAADDLAPPREGAEEDPAARQERAQNNIEQSRENLEGARDQLRDALEQAGDERSADMQAAAQRQQELSEQAEQLQQSMQQAQSQGGLTPEQNQSAQKKMEQAKQAMQQAQQSLQQGRQATASSQQQQAAEKLQQAQQEMQQNRPMGEEQRQAMQDLAQEQQKLQEDIIQLASEAEERKNQRAKNALDEAADAAQRAAKAMQDGDSAQTEEQQERAREKLEEAAKALEEERDRYMDLRQEELLFRIKDELSEMLDKQRPITEATREAGKVLEREDRLSRPQRRRLNAMSEEEKELATKVEFIAKALEEEGTQVFTFVLRANKDDLEEISRRLSGRNPDPGEYTVMLQTDVEDRSVQLLDALERERQRREEERKQQQQQQQEPQSENKFNPQRERLVSMIAELQMLKTLEQDIQGRSKQMQALMDARGGDSISETEAALIERLANRHNEITKMFLQIKAAMEEAMAADGQQDPEQGKEGGK